MSRPRFSEMLASRRRQLGLTVEQASRILRLREDVLVAFEEGDFERMPQSGYAQGMLSSYARYLGLNPREIVDYFQEELYEYVNGSSSHELRRRTRDTQMGRGVKGYDLVNEAGSRPKAYVEYHGLLPTAGGPAGDMGAFATTTPARPRRSVPLAGSGPSAASAYAAQQEQLAPARRPYNSAARTERAQSAQSNRAERQRRRNAQQRRRYDVSDPSRRLLSSDMQGLEDGYYDSRGREVSGLYMRDDVSTRSVRPREYTDDMRLDDRANPYERASTISGRRSSRNIARIDRPNVRRRTGSDYAPAGGAASRSRGAAPRGGSGRGGRSGQAGFFADPRHSVFAIVIVLCIVLTCILTFSVSSCVNKDTSAPEAKTVTVNSSDQGTSQPSSQGSSGTDASSTDAKKDAQATSDTAAGSSAASADAQASAATYTPTVVKVSVKSGSFTWLEITNDGQSVIADSVTGPWEQEFTVTDSITVQAGDPSSVTVTNNGANVAFTSKASGLGSLSVKGTKPPETTTDADASSADGGASSQGSSSLAADASAN